MEECSPLLRLSCAGVCVMLRREKSALWSVFVAYKGSERQTEVVVETSFIIEQIQWSRDTHCSFHWSSERCCVELMLSLGSCNLSQKKLKFCYVLVAWVNSYMPLLVSLVHYFVFMYCFVGRIVL